MSSKNLIRIGISQINPKLCDFETNTKKILDSIEKAKILKTELLIFSIGSLSGFPPKDLIFNKNFLAATQKSLKKIVTASQNISIVLNFIDFSNENFYNSAALIHDGKILGKAHQTKFPQNEFCCNFYFSEGKNSLVFSLKNRTFSLLFGAENPNSSRSDFLINIDASPYYFSKSEKFYETAKKFTKASKKNLIYANLVGLQDDLLFDGGSFFMNSSGKILASANKFEEEFLVCDFEGREEKKLKNKNVIFLDAKDFDKKPVFKNIALKKYNFVSETYAALLFSLKDYLSKTGFKKVVIGLSGGIDSALVAVLATEAVGKENVICISMPTVFSSTDTKNDAKKLAKNLGVKFYEIPIENLRTAYSKIFDEIFAGLAYDTTEESIQSRIRGNILMAISSKFRAVLLPTGNKSEIATGYCTLYGDTAGGFAVLKDVYKTTIFEICKFYNEKSKKKKIPDSIIFRPPTAELKANQKDEDLLPKYEILDKILRLYVEENKTASEIIRELKIGKETVLEIIRLTEKNEFKRRQSPFGPKLTKKAFGDRNMPINYSIVDGEK